MTRGKTLGGGEARVGVNNWLKLGVGRYYTEALAGAGDGVMDLRLLPGATANGRATRSSLRAETCASTRRRTRTARSAKITRARLPGPHGSHIIAHSYAPGHQRPIRAPNRANRHPRSRRPIGLIDDRQHPIFVEHSKGTACFLIFMGTSLPIVPAFILLIEGV